ncbi:MAG: NADP-dependent isocitrate dehydrogenase, partial [Actinomycetes bacterium]
VNTPHILRSGEFFEMRFRVHARQPIAKPVLAVSHAYLRDLTLNTFKPSPAGETSDGTFYRMEFDALEAGEADIVRALNAVQGGPVDIGGYYRPDPPRVAAAMRPCEAFNEVLATLRGA